MKPPASFTIIIPAYDFIQWVDMDYIREKLIEDIKEKKHNQLGKYLLPLIKD